MVFTYYSGSTDLLVFYVDTKVHGPEPLVGDRRGSPHEVTLCDS